MKTAARGVATMEAGDQESLWSDTREPGGGKPFAFANTEIAFRRCFPQGASLMQLSADSDAVAAMASSSCLMLVNLTDRPITVAAEKLTHAMGPFDVLFVDR